ncbi:MAG: Rne/Rng family ribonuclease [Cyanobacteria bacterium SIG30]|nr:Rne/Rng family ribonuclease [Cyanobacteria bacterium SIG30]
MTKKIVISEKDNIAAVLENGKASEFFINRGDVLLGDVYLARVDNILPSIEAAFVDVGLGKMGFIHTDDIIGKGILKEKVKPNQKLIVQVIKEPTGHKGPRVTTAISLPGRFLVLLPGETGVNVSRKITSAKERARLKSIVNLLKPVGVGVIVRTEAENQTEGEIQEDIEMLLEKWQSIVASADTIEAPALLYRDQDLLYRVVREACDTEVEEILVDSTYAFHRCQQLLQHWNLSDKIRVNLHKENESILVTTKVNKEILNALQKKVNLPLGGYLFIEQTEALTVVDVNSGKFVSSSNQAETILKTNLQAADEIARQLKLRNIGGIVIVDFIDMVSRADKLAVLEHFELALEKDKAKPQIGQLSDLGLVELTRHRQGQSLNEVFTKKCDECEGQGFKIEDLKFANSNAQGDLKAKMNKIKGPFAPQFTNQNKKFKNKNKNKNQNFQKEENNKPQEQPAEIKEEVKVEVTPQIEEKPVKKPTRRGKRKSTKVDEIKPEIINEDKKPSEKTEIKTEEKTKTRKTKTKKEIKNDTPKEEIKSVETKEEKPVKKPVRRGKRKVEKVAEN